MCQRLQIMWEYSIRDRILLAGVYIWIFLFFSLMILWNPLQVDDYMFMERYLRAGGGENLTLRGLYDMWLINRDIDNGRLCNVLEPVFIYSGFGKAIFPWLTGGMMVLVIWLGVGFMGNSGVRGDKCCANNCGAKVVLTLVMFLGCMVFLPWRNYLFVLTYALNYIYGAAIVLIYIRVMISLLDRGKGEGIGNQRDDGCWRGKVLYGIGVLLAVLAGAWHEGFAIATVVGLVIYGLVRRKATTPGWWLLVVLTAVTAISMAYTPGLIHRGASEISGDGERINLTKFIADYAAFCLLIVSIVVMLAKRSWREWLKQKIEETQFLLFATAAVCGFLMSVVFTHTPRVAFYPELCSLICLGILYGGVVIRIGNIGRIAVGIVAAMLILIFGISALVWQKKICDDTEQIMAEFAQSKSGTVFHDIVKPEEVPLYTLYLPGRLAWVTPFHYSCVNNYLEERERRGLSGEEAGKRIAVVPEEVRDGTDAERRDISGGLDAEVIGETLVMPYREYKNMSTEFITIRIGLEGDVDREVSAMVLPFEREGCGRMLYVRPVKVSAKDIVRIY